MSGLTKLRAELLARALAKLCPDAFSFKINEAPLERIDKSELGAATLLVFNENDRHAATQAAQELRTDSFFWNPIHFIMPEPPLPGVFGDDWSFFFHPTAPPVEKLANDLLECPSLKPARRNEIVRSSFAVVADDLRTLSRSLNKTLIIHPERLRKAITDAIDALSHSSTNEVFQSLSKTLQESLALPGPELMDHQSILALVVMGEMKARESGNEDYLTAKLHTLNNVLRLALWKPVEPRELSTAILRRLTALREDGLNAIPDKHRAQYLEICNDIALLLEEIKNQQIAGETGAQIDRYTSRLNLLLTPRRAVSDEDMAMVVSRIVVAEDDHDWRRLIVAVLKQIAPNLEIQEAASVIEAQELLKDTRPALALIDLGLPPDRDTEPVLAAGLGLIKRFTESDNRGQRFLHRFIVLTAAENYVDAVRQALDYGISSGRYLQKNPKTWETELTAQVRLTLQPVRKHAPRIEVFERTSRIIRVEGLEIKLDYPQWCLLATLAKNRKERWCEPEKLSSLLYWNYSVKPDARSKETEALDFEERILNQLPHYTSELNQRLADAYMKARHQPLSMNVISFDPELGYRLNASASVLDQVEDQLSNLKPPTVLVVEDSEEWSTQITDELLRYGFEVQLARHIDDAKRIITTDQPDLISLDLELPKTKSELEAGEANAGAAVELLEFLQRGGFDCPIAILTAIPWQDRIMLDVLRKGVRLDDYLSKGNENPIGRLAKSLARLWQEKLAQTEILDWDPSLPLHRIKIDSDTKTLTAVAGFPVEPSGEGLKILAVLSATPNVFVSRGELLDALYGEHEEGPEEPDRALNSHIKRLRKSISDATAGSVPGDEVLCGERGIYWLRGIVRSD